MKKISLSILCLTFFLLGCTTEFDIFNSNDSRMTNLPPQSQELGRAVAAEMRAIVQNLNKMGVNYFDADNSAEFRERFFSDLHQASPTARSTRASTDQIQMNWDGFAERVSELTPIQIEFIIRITKANNESTSFQELSAKLVDINKDIVTQVPRIEQERLFNVTAVLYYGFKEIENLERQGQMLLTPHTAITTPRLRSGVIEQPPGSGGGFWASCRRILAAGWAIAVAEPTPLGEIVMAVFTVVIAGVLLFEVILCSGSSSSGSNTSLCSVWYDRCQSPGNPNAVGGPGGFPSRCGDCFVRCLAEGVWPFHMCPL